MSISTYSDLQTAVADYAHRTDLTSVLPTMILLAEDAMSADIVSRSMDAKTTLSTVAGTSTVALPTDMVEMRRLQILDSYNTVLKYVSPDQLGVDYATNTNSRPIEFSVIGGNLELAPVPDAVYSLELTYKKRIPALSNSNTTNWLLTSWPSVYLYGTLIHVFGYIMDFERQAYVQKLYKDAVDSINAVDWYSGSTMRVKAK